MKTYKVLPLVLAMLFLHSCLPSTQLSERAIVEAVGIDKKDDEFSVSIQYYNPENTNSESSQDSYVSHSAKTISKAMEEIKAKLGKELYFAHNNIIIIGKAAAESDVNDILSFFDFDSQTKSDICIFISEKAENIISFQDEKNSITPLSILKVTENSAKNGKGCNCKMYSVIEYSQSKNGSFVLPIGKITEEKLFEIDGACLFKNGALIDTLSEEETRGLQWYNGDIKEYLFSTNECDIIAEGCETTVKPLIFDDTPVFKIDVSVKLKRPTEKLKKEDETLIKEAISSQITREIKKVISVAFTNHGCDIFEFSKYLKINFPDFSERFEQWYTSPVASFEIDVSCFFA